VLATSGVLAVAIPLLVEAHRGYRWATMTGGVYEADAVI
jgi:hypothetical protein